MVRTRRSEAATKLNPATSPKPCMFVKLRYISYKYRSITL